MYFKYYFVNDAAVSDHAVFDFPLESGVVSDLILSLALALFPAARTTLSVSLSLWKLTTPKNMTKGYNNKTRKSFRWKEGINSHSQGSTLTLLFGALSDQ